jgi:hypothetical protein
MPPAEVVEPLEQDPDETAVVVDDGDPHVQRISR